MPLARTVDPREAFGEMLRLLAVLFLGCSSLTACRRDREPQPKTAPAPAEPAALSTDEEIRAVYPRDDAAPDPLAEKVCRALHELPGKRRASCCGTAPGLTVTSECTRTLSASLRAGAVTLDAATVEQCARRFAESLAGCEWVGPHRPAPPAPCDALVTGTLAAGSQCRSSLECQKGLHCRGGGPTDLGKCGEPLPAGAPCDLAVDTLASYALQAVERAHPECAGYCERRRCFDARAPGQPCRVDVQCGPGTRCAGKTCRKGTLGAESAPCVPGGCTEGLRCMGGLCARPKATGESCTADVECRGACLPSAGAGTDEDAPKTCGPRC